MLEAFVPFVVYFNKTELSSHTSTKTSRGKTVHWHTPSLRGETFPRVKRSWVYSQPRNAIRPSLY